jgi:hypothetical protein
VGVLCDIEKTFGVAHRRRIGPRDPPEGCQRLGLRHRPLSGPSARPRTWLRRSGQGTRGASTAPRLHRSIRARPPSEVQRPIDCRGRDHGEGEGRTTISPGSWASCRSPSLMDDRPGLAKVSVRACKNRRRPPAWIFRTLFWLAGPAAKRRRRCKCAALSEGAEPPFREAKAPHWGALWKGDTRPASLQPASFNRSKRTFPTSPKSHPLPKHVAWRAHRSDFS